MRSAWSSLARRRSTIFSKASGERSGRGLLGDRFKTPVSGVFRTLLDPLDENLLLCRGEWFLVFGRRHQVVRVGAEDSLHHLAGVWVAGHDRRAIVAIRERPVAPVEPQLRLARLLVRSVARVTPVREDRLDVAAEVEFFAGESR